MIFRLLTIILLGWLPFAIVAIITVALLDYLIGPILPLLGAALGLGCGCAGIWAGFIIYDRVDRS